MELRFKEESLEGAWNEEEKMYSVFNVEQNNRDFRVYAHDPEGQAVGYKIVGNNSFKINQYFEGF